MKLLKILLLLLTLHSFVNAQHIDSVVTIYRGERMFNYVMNNDTTYFYSSGKLLSIIVNNANGHVFKTNTGYISKVIKEDNAEFTYVLDSVTWILQSETLFYQEGIVPYYKKRCQAITQRGTRCRRKGDPYCWQHD